MAGMRLVEVGQGILDDEKQCVASKHGVSMFKVGFGRTNEEAAGNTKREGGQRKGPCEKGGGRWRTGHLARRIPHIAHSILVP